MTVAGDAEPGTVVVLNGTPRSGKSTVARALQESWDGIWINLGVDVFADVIPEGLRPGIGLRPGGERPDLEDAVVTLFDALYASVVASQPIRAQCGGRRRPSRRLLEAVGDPGEGRRRAAVRCRPTFVGVRCPVEVIMARRDAGAGRGRYVTSAPDGTVPDIVGRWERAVHDPGLYDLEVDTSRPRPRRAPPPLRAGSTRGRRWPSPSWRNGAR